MAGQLKIFRQSIFEDSGVDSYLVSDHFRAIRPAIYIGTVLGNLDKFIFIISKLFYTRRNTRINVSIIERFFPEKKMGSSFL